MKDWDWSASIFLDSDRVDLSGGIKIISPLTPGELRYWELTRVGMDGHEVDCEDKIEVEEVPLGQGGWGGGQQRIKRCKSCGRRMR